MNEVRSRFYEVTVNGKVYYTNIKRKWEALRIGKSQSNIGNNVAVFRKYPETNNQPSHSEVIWYKLI